MLRAYRRIFFGERPGRWQALKDAPWTFGWPVVLLLAALVIIGLNPQSVIGAIEPGFRLFLK
jgi:NADH:ubiquinone oxidoreductase subunit 4 (subunit M)